MLNTFDIFTELTEFPAIQELSIGSRNTLRKFILAQSAMNATQQAFLPKLERLIIRRVSWMQHSDPLLQRQEPRPSLAEQFETVLRPRRAFTGSPTRYIKFVTSMNLNGWNFKEEGLVEEFEEDNGREPGYICECHACQPYTDVEDTDDTEESDLE